MKKYLAFFILFLTCNGFAAVDKIVAIVNDDPITSRELEDRIKMVAFLSNIDISTARNNPGLKSAALNSLIDEELLEQQQNKMGIKITDADIANGIRNIEGQNNMPSGHLISILNQNGISVASFKKKIAIDILKYRLISEMFAPNVKITNDQFEAVVFHHKVKDADIKLNILSSKSATKEDYKKMVSLAKRLKTCDTLKESTYKNVASLEIVETKFTNLDPQIQSVVKNLQNNTNSSVVKTGDSFKIFMLCHKKLDSFTDEETMYLSNFLINHKVSLKLKKYQTTLRKKAYIKIL